MDLKNFWRHKRVVLTGHTGFKGAWLSYWLWTLGAEVTGIALLPPSQPNLYTVLGVSKKIKSYEADIRDFDGVRKLVEKSDPQIVIHMAAQSLVRPSYLDPLGTYGTNVLGTAHVLESCRALSHLEGCLVITSDKCYENRGLKKPLDEEFPMGGNDPYSSSKGAAELVTASYRHSFFNHARVATARAGNVIGGGDWSTDRLVPDLIRSLSEGKSAPIRNPDSIRPWQHVLDPLYGYLILCQKIAGDPKKYASGWNFGPDTGELIPVSKISDSIVEYWGTGTWHHEIPQEELHEAHTLTLSSAKAHTQLGWKPRLPSLEALQWTTNWYKAFYQNENMEEMTENQINQFLESR